MEPQCPSKTILSSIGFLCQHRIVKFCLIFIVIVIVSVVFIHYGYDIIGKQKDSHFTVVVDCGSTGTRVNVYEWGINGGKNGKFPIFLGSYDDKSMKYSSGNNGCQYHCMQTKPGLDKYVGNSSGVRASLEPLILWAESVIPIERHRDTRVFVLATAGLRRIPMDDASRVLEDVEDVIKEHSFVWKRNWIRVLSGREEAYYGWIALNYKMGYLNESLRVPTLGILDLGGSSLQVAMEAGKVKEDSHLVILNTGVVEHQVMTYSLPAFGLNKAFDRTVSLLVDVNLMRNETQFVVKHPCLSSRFVGNYSCSTCSMPGSFRLVGEPNLEKCKLLAKAVGMNKSIEEWSEPKFEPACRRNFSTEGKNALNILINMNSGVQYHALSGFFAVYNMLNMTGKTNFTKIWEKAQLLCLGIWDEHINASSSQNCFKVLYLASLIDDGLCLGNASIIFGPGDISWTLGASLIEGEHIWTTYTETSRTPPPQHMKVVSNPVFLFVILVGLLVVVYRCQIKLPMLRKRSFVGVPLRSYSHSQHRPH